MSIFLIVCIAVAMFYGLIIIHQVWMQQPLGWFDRMWIIAVVMLFLIDSVETTVKLLAQR